MIRRPGRSRRRAASLVLAVLGSLLALPSGATGSARLRIQSGYGLTVPVLGETVRHFVEVLEAQGGNGLRIKLYDAGKLVPTLQIFDAVAAGAIDAGFTFPAYWMGKIPAATIFAAVPFGPPAPELLAWIHQGGGLRIWRRLYAELGTVPVPCGVLPPEASGWFRKPIESAEDLRGLKIRYAGLGGKVLQKLGASITMLAAGDIFLALERGVIDATEYSMPAVDRPLGFYKVAKHYYFPGWHQPASLLELVVNLRTWQALAPEQRAAIETACQATTLFSLERGLAVQAEALAFFRKQGVQIHRWSPELLDAFRRATAQVMAEASRRDPDFAEAWSSLQAFRARYAQWSSLADLP